ncbi:MAG: alpha-amylase family glycosyl hydrolase [Bacteroidales bacterium]
MKKHLLLLSTAALLCLNSCSNKHAGVVAPESNPNGDKVYYEIFVRAFADSDGDGIGDLNGITENLDYLTELGVGGLWLMPIATSPSYHGYDVTNYKEVDPDYGTIEDFERLTSEAKKRGIDVITDFVINHSSNQHPWFLDAMSSPDAKYRDYYKFLPQADIERMCLAGEVPMVDDKIYEEKKWKEPKIDTTDKDYKYFSHFGPGMPDLEHGVVPDLNPVYYEIVDAAKFWMEHGAAGLRLDAVRHLYQDSLGVENVRLLERFYNDVNDAYPGTYMVGEVFSISEEVAPFFGGLPTVFSFDSWWKLENALIGRTEPKSYAEEMERLNKKLENVSKTYNSGTKLTNHDESRAISLLGESVDKAKIAAMALLTMPGQPYVYYGEELGMGNLKGVGRGDEYVREPLLWGNEYTTSWKENTAPTATVKEQLADENSMLNFYKTVIGIRNATPALQRGAFTPVPSKELPAALMAWSRSLGFSEVYTLMNASEEEINYTIDINLTNAKELFKKGDAKFIADGEKTILTLPAYSILLIEKL